jgi:hypothetical protein
MFAGFNKTLMLGIYFWLMLGAYFKVLMSAYSLRG